MIESPPVEPEGQAAPPPDPEPAAAVEPGAEEFLALAEAAPAESPETRLRALLEAVVYVTDEPLSASQIAAGLGEPVATVQRLLDGLAAEYAKPEHGLAILHVAGGYKMGTKAEHNEGVRAFVKKLKPPLKLSLAALETLAVIAYKQPITAPEVMEIRGVQGAGVLKTLLDRKLIATAGRKNVIGRPILYKTTRDFLVQFGLKDLSELPTLKEFEELARLSTADAEVPAAAGEEAQPTDAGSPEPALIEDGQAAGGTAGAQTDAEATLEMPDAPAAQPGPEGAEAEPPAPGQDGED